MGFFDDKSDAAYAKAAEAVKAGLATDLQKKLNEEAAKRTGSIGTRARDAYKG